ncbi:MAG: HAMP domain-containing histidine kinase, partial [Isosphaeraceae bacterium]|nr:HAMP domain-containing histidine kinase [Isosphaeraceae bacterium]
LVGSEMCIRVSPDTVRLLFTGYADIQAVINAINQGGIFRYILKPWDPYDLEATIRQAADHYELLAERRRLIAELQATNAQLTQANRELAESNELKSAFLEVASHELNTPINIVQGMSELLKLLNPQRSEPERGIVEKINTAARQLGRMVATMLKLVKANDFRRPLRVEATDLTRLLREVVDQVAPFVEARRLRFQTEIPDDLGPFEIDADKVRDAVVNLLTNAIKFTPDGGEIALRAHLAAPEEAEIRVEDRGIGLEPRALARLFTPFFTEFDPSRHSSGDFGFGKRGLGLGLSLVKKFVELHGGRVAAESTLGQGTLITITLPRHPRPPQPESPAEAAPDRDGSRTGG